jgi:hypothetical protein
LSSKFGSFMYSSSVLASDTGACVYVSTSVFNTQRTYMAQVGDLDI